MHFFCLYCSIFPSLIRIQEGKWMRIHADPDPPRLPPDEMWLDKYNTFKAFRRILLIKLTTLTLSFKFWISKPTGIRYLPDVIRRGHLDCVQVGGMRHVGVLRLQDHVHVLVEWGGRLPAAHTRTTRRGFFIEGQESLRRTWLMDPHSFSLLYLHSECGPGSMSISVIPVP